MNHRNPNDLLFFLLVLLLLAVLTCEALVYFDWPGWIRLVTRLVPPGWLRAWLLGW